MTATPAPDDQPNSQADELEVAADKVRVLVVAVARLESELSAERALSATLVDAVSKGYVRGRWYRNLERAETPTPYTLD
jgi:hypothetical protein